MTFSADDIDKDCQGLFHKSKNKLEPDIFAANNSINAVDLT